MSDLWRNNTRDRGKTLLIVEGEHEKNTFFELIVKCFPRLNIKREDIWIYGTNIYILYGDIQEEYGTDWYQEDIDLPYLISKKISQDNIKYKEDYTNIILVFDYERQEPLFSQETIMKMQQYFTDSTDVGKLYINFPMLESYQDFADLPDENFLSRKYLAPFKKGTDYKSRVSKSIISRTVTLPSGIMEQLKTKFGVEDSDVCKECAKQLLMISNSNELEKKVEPILANVMADNQYITAKYFFPRMLEGVGYIEKGRNYWEHMKNLFQQIIIHNIRKASMIQQIESKDDKIKELYEKLDLLRILEIQNECSKDETGGFIWVLNTSVFVIADYNFSLVEEE